MIVIKQSIPCAGVGGGDEGQGPGKLLLGLLLLGIGGVMVWKAVDRLAEILRNAAATGDDGASDGQDKLTKRLSPDKSMLVPVISISQLPLLLLLLGLPITSPFGPLAVVP